MKHLMILFFVAISTMMMAQEESRHSLGPTIGYNHSWLSDDPDGASSKPGFNVGLIYNYSLKEHWGLGAGILYSAEGWHIDATDENANVAYVRVPLRLQYFFGEWGQAFRPKLYAGPSLAFLAGAKTDIGGNTLDFKDQMESFDVGLLVGLGFNYRLRDRMWLNLDLGYTHGFLNAYDSETLDNKNRLLNANVGVAFGF
jgi:hypothetical protein